MTSKIFRTTLFVAAIVLLCSLSVIMGFLYNYFDDVQENQLEDELSLAAIGTEQGGIAFLSSAESQRFRLTWVAPDGTVLFDTHADTVTMENHGDREEIRQALAAGYGSSTRYSNTLTERTIYNARRLSDGTVLRISVSQTTPAALALGMFHPIVFVAIIAIALSAFLARRMSRKITEPLNTLDLEHPLENDTYEELSPLLNRINQQHRQISAQLHTLHQRADEFNHITANMSEGLVLLDKHKRILSINPAARALFCASSDCTDAPFVTLCTLPTLSDALEQVLQQGSSELSFQKDSCLYRFVLSRIESEGQIVGILVLIFDVTRQYAAEQSRREFSANVSHELKTPLQSIIGSAELLENGLVQAEDIPRFVGLIRKEAARLVNLVEDIIRLSALDEGSAPAKEDVELYALTQEVFSLLQPVAQDRQIRLELSGSPCTIAGVRRLLHEVLYNLCDNAIKYNKDGGSVHVSLQPLPDSIRLQIRDTGIGIPEAHQSRVFERFYRVDKSHSRRSGGTGLGLSIVKHAVLYHGGQIELQSTPQEGTTITLIFPVPAA